MNPYKLFLDANKEFILDFIFIKDQRDKLPSLYIVVDRDKANVHGLNYDIFFENSGPYLMSFPLTRQQSEIDTLRRYLRERKD